MTESDTTNVNRCPPLGGTDSQDSAKNPTNAVGGSFILSLLYRQTNFSGSTNCIWWAKYEVSTNCVRGISRLRPFRLSMNNPPTALVGLRTLHTVSPLSDILVHNPTALLFSRSVWRR